MSFHMEFGYPREAEIAKKEKWPILIPVGTMEYHGSHCPYGCDTLVAMGLIEEIAQKIDAVIFPPIWYGVASYAVGGPETNTIQVDCDTFEAYIYNILKSLFLAGFNRNIYLVICHQGEDYLPMKLACMKAAKKLTFEYLDETKGYGWWGNNKNKDFYTNLSATENPWNWVRVINGLSETARAKLGADHAGKYECSMLERLFPGTIKLERLPECDDWFVQSAIEMSYEMGDQMVNISVEDHVANMKSE